jgi:hypothetical protein
MRDALDAMRFILMHPRRKYSTKLLKDAKSKMEQAYDNSIRAETAVLLAKGRMEVSKHPVPKGIVNKHVATILKQHKKIIKKAMKVIKKKIDKIVVRHAKTMAKHAAKKGHLKKAKKAIRHELK